MINHSAFEVAHKKYKNSVMPFLTELLTKAKQDKKYQGIKILHNTALTIEAVLKIEPLILAGADVTVSSIKLLPPQEEALKILQAANVKINLEHQFNEKYDFHLDCCGELLQAQSPKVGGVELTQTGSEIYKQANIAYPLISVDDSSIKFLETFFGTGDGFIRALYKFAGKEMYDKPYVVFGFGKVGKGIIHALKKCTDNIATIVDVDPTVVSKKSFPNVQFIHGNEKDKVKEAIKKAYCVVTATGVEGVISKYYSFKKQDFGNALLANMGADDEYGKNFIESEVLFEKKPLNFSISEPTTMKYLDPIFYAHNLGIDLLLSRRMQNGYHSFPDNISNMILEKWQKFHEESTLMLS